MKRSPVIEVRGGVATVTSPYSGRSFRVDRCDMRFVEGVSWAVCWAGGRLAVMRWEREGRRMRRVLLSREIMGAGFGERVVFRNGDSTDLRRCNLRLCDDEDGYTNRPPVIRIRGGTVHVTNPYSGVRFMVSLEDLDLVRRHNWNIHSGCRYLSRSDSKLLRMGCRSESVMLHAAIMKPKRGQVVDFRSGDVLDCRRSNLRLCRRRDAQKNRPGDRDSRSGYKGVHYSGTPGKWLVRITADGRCRHIGTFTDVVEAAEAYNRAALKYHGEFAWLNVLPGKGRRNRRG